MVGIALRNAGVKLKAPVAGLSIGLITPITSIQNEWDERTKAKLYVIFLVLKSFY